MGDALHRTVLCLACWLTTAELYAETSQQPDLPASRAEATAEPALAEPAVDCVQAHEHAQVSRIDGHLMHSRSMLKQCSRQACPAAVQRDCVRWLDEVSSQIPTVVFEAITDAGAAQKVTVVSQQRVVTQELDGRPIQMDPGYYEFSFELPGRAPKSVSVLLKQGEKNKLVTVDFRVPAAVSPPAPVLAPAPTAVSTSHPGPPGEPTTTRSSSTAVYVLSGIAVAGALAATVFGVSTKTKNDNARESCAPDCSEKRIDEINRWAMVTDVSIAVAAGSAIAAVVVHLSQGSTAAAHRRADSVAFKPSLGCSATGGWAGLEGSF